MSTESKADKSNCRCGTGNYCRVHKRYRIQSDYYAELKGFKTYLQKTKTSIRKRKALPE